MPEMNKIVEDHMKKVAKKCLESGKEYLEVEFREVLNEVFIDMVTLMLFGDTREAAPKVDGQPIVDAISEYLINVWKIDRSIPNMIFSGYPNDLNLLPSKRRNNAFYAKIVD
jgi:hypothetical protein